MKNEKRTSSLNFNVQFFCKKIENDLVLCFMSQLSIQTKIKT